MKMTTQDARNEIKTILRCAGPMYDGGTDDSRERLAKEWEETELGVGTVEKFVKAGCWCPLAAERLHSLGFRPGYHTLSYCDGVKPPMFDGSVKMDPMHAVCNGDVSIEDVRW